MFDYRYALPGNALQHDLQDRAHRRPRLENLARTLAGLLGTMVFASICLLGATAAAYAEGREGAGRRTLVHSADLDLSHEAGRRALHRRLLTAARSVCGEASSHHSAKAAEARCIREAMQDAMAAAS